MLSSLASILICPENAFLDTLILPETEFVKSACDRSFGPGGRMGPVTNMKWSGGYSYHPFKISTTKRRFQYSRRRPGPQPVQPKPSNVSVLWTIRLQETLINGVLQGRKQTDVRGGSAVCRLRTCRLVMETLALLATPMFMDGRRSSTYADLKGASVLEERRQVKRHVKVEALEGWVPNLEDNFNLDIG